MDILRSRDMVTWTVPWILRWVIIAAVQWTLLTADYTGKEGTKWGEGTKSVTLDANGKIF